MTTKKVENARIEVDVPINYNSITLRKFIAYMNAKSDIDQCIAITGLSRKQVEGFMYNTIYTINDMFQDALMTGTPKHEHTFFINQMHLGFIPDLNSLTFREYVDLDVLAGQIWKGEEVNYKELPRLLAILFRPVEMKVKNKYTIKPYVTDEIDTYIDNIYDMTMDRVNGSLVFFFDYRKRITAQFSSLFSAKSEEDDDGDYSTPSGLEKYGWYHILQTITERDITKFKQILDKDATEIFTHLAYTRDYQASVRLAMRQQNR